MARRVRRDYPLDMATVRPATSDDAAAIGRIYVDSWRSTYAGLLPERLLLGMSSVRTAASFARSVGRPGSGVLVAEWQKAGVVGFATAGPSRPGVRAAETYAGEVYTLYVDDDFRGLGLGRALLAAAFEDLGRVGAWSALVWVLAGNPARFFYEAMRGVRAAERQGRLAGAPIHEIAYGWADTRQPLGRRTPLDAR